MIKFLLLAALLCLAVPVLVPVPVRAAEALRIVALGDSLTAGYGLDAATQSYPAQLQTALAKEGLAVAVQNAGLSGDTTQGGLARVAAAVQGAPKPALVIIALGANDMLQNVPPAQTEQNLRGILTLLRGAGIPVLLFGMQAGPWAEPAYRRAFEAIYSKLADEFDVALYPFFLEGVALRPDLNLGDGFHPNERGIAVMVKATLPLVEKALRAAGVD